MASPYFDLIDDVRKLNVDIARRIVVPIYSSIAAAGMTPATYKVPNTLKFAVMKMWGHLVIPYATTPTVDMTVLYGMNCRLKILEQDTPLNLTENSATYLSLASILPASGEPMVFGREHPWIIKPGATIRVEPTVITTPAATAEYGIVLDGVLVRQ